MSGGIFIMNFAVEQAAGGTFAITLDRDSVATGAKSCGPCRSITFDVKSAARSSNTGDDRLRRPLTPLLKKERHAGGRALIADGAEPVWVRGAGIWTALAAGDHPVEYGGGLLSISRGLWRPP